MPIPHEGFLRAICEAPDDDTPRLIYSDWLDEHGDGDRAEFIRLQIELTRADLGPNRQRPLRKREAELLALRGEEWRQPFTEPMNPRFERGFVSALRLSGQALAEDGSHFFQAAPIQDVALFDMPVDDLGSSARLAQCEHLGQLRAISLYEDFIGEDSARVLFASPHLAGLRKLHLGEGDTTPSMIRILGECPMRLRELLLWDFHNGDLGDEGMTLIANAPAFADLTNLDLLQTGVGAAGARALAESPYLLRLERLSFGFQACGYAPNYIGAEGVRALARSPNLAGLRHLGLGLTRLGDAGLAALARSSHLGRLESLELALGEVGCAGLAALANSPLLDGLTWLNLSTNNLGDQGVRVLAASPHAARLETLWLAMNQIGTAGVRALAESPHLDGLRRLGLGANVIGPDAVGVLLGNNRFAQLDELHLVGNRGLTSSDHSRLKERFGDRLKC